MPIRVFAFTGLKQSGKSTAALCAKHELKSRGQNVLSLHFAQSLKDMLTIFGLTHAELYGEAKEVPSPLLCGKTPRWAMQALGTEWGRDCIGEDIWVNHWKRKAAEFLKGPNNCILVEDLRFKNELAALKEVGAHTFRIVNPRISLTPEPHPSEVMIPHLDVNQTILNDGTMQQLSDAVQEAVGKAFSGET